VSFPNLVKQWYDYPGQQPAGQILSQYYQVPNCGYTIGFKMYPSYGSASTPLPVEINWDNKLTAFVFSKCA